MRLAGAVSGTNSRIQETEAGESHLLATLIGAASIAVWTYLLFARGGFWRMREDRIAALKPSAKRVAVVIPARDEAGGIGAAVASLAPLPVFVVDDHSSDDTASIARGAGATVITSAPLPPGWTGKMWAVQQGVQAALGVDPDYLLLTDADVVHAPGSVTALLAGAEAQSLDLASLMVELRMDSFASRALMPAFVFFFLMLYPPAWIADPKRKTAGAAGGCILIRREALERAGSIERIRAELIDDCALAAAVKRSGGRVWLGLSRATRSVREYGTFGEIWGVISRTAYTQLRYSPLLLAGTVAALLVTYVAPPALALTGRPLGLLAWAAMALAYAPTLQFYRRSLFWAPVLPLVAVFYLGATIDSAVRYWRGQGGAWKGRAQAINSRISG